jgi:uncharacterized protein DUF6401
MTAHAVLDQLMAQVGVDGLVAAMRNPGLMAAVDQHAATIRETLRAAGCEMDVFALAGYARSALAVLTRGGHSLPDPSTVDWSRAGGHLLRLVAVCSLAEAADLL